MSLSTLHVAPGESPLARRDEIHALREFDADFCPGLRRMGPQDASHPGGVFGFPRALYCFQRFFRVLPTSVGFLVRFRRRGRL